MRTLRQHRLFHSARGQGLRTLFFIAAAITLLTLDQHFQALHTVRSVFSAAVYPVEWLVNAPGIALHNIGTALQSHAKLVEKNQALQRELLLTRVHVEQFNTLRRENRRLRTLLGTAAELPGNLRITSILTVDLTPYRNLITLNIGRSSGIRPGLPILDAGGIVGQVQSAGPFSSQVILITDPASAIPVEIERTGLATLAFGTGSLNLLTLPYLPNNADVHRGDELTSSGLGGRYPRGYPVAVITQVIPRPGQRFARVEARPLAKLGREHEVLVYTFHHATPLPESKH